MKFINYLTSISGVGIFPLISLLVFFIFFTVLAIYIVRVDRERMKYMESLPIEHGKPESKQGQDHL
jgi:cytochrome c oxidase cbb3-type subunit 3